MKLRNMFVKDINRNINGVVKVGDETSVVQELDEYIITKELRKHFSTFLTNYVASLDQPTDKMGVWISGFFGSGKSHFLKMLSYLLENKTVGGKTVYEYFVDKFDDPFMAGQAQRASSVETRTILFNVDIEGKKKNKEAIKNVFAKVFYDHLGYYGTDLKVVHLEQFLNEEGKLTEFKEEFARLKGKSWEQARVRYRFHQDEIVNALINVLGMSKEAAINAFKGEDTNELSIKNLVSDIKKYVDSKGKNFRLLFMVDEIGQYIGDDSNLMLNLQSLVEEIGTQCKGKVWVMVTSQEAIDEIVKISGDDFSKIQGRFNTRLSLSSSSVDEVIEKRVLAKTEDASQLLEMKYNKEQAVLRNLYTFSDSVLDIKGYQGPQEFASTYPFVPYQFRVIQDVLGQIRKHGNSGKHLSSGERSMLSAFQEAAQKVQDKDEKSLVPFYNFYDTVHTFLDGPIKRVIERCERAAENGDGIEMEDVNVLKLLYLVRYLDDIKANVDNIAILMIDHIDTDKIRLRQKVQKSLDRLYSQNYISRNGDTYYFLTDEEQDIARDIKNTNVDASAVISGIGKVVYDNIFDNKNKIRYGKNDFAFNRYTDEVLHGASNSGMSLRIITIAHDNFYNTMWLSYQTTANPEAFIVLPEDSSYFAELEEARKIEKYVAKQNTSAMPETVQEIIARKRREKNQLEYRAKDSLEQAIKDARVFVGGEEIKVTAPNAKTKIELVLSRLAEHVYSKNYMIENNHDSDADILKILRSSIEQPTLDIGNPEAEDEINMWLETRLKMNQPVSMADIQKRYQAAPYGWKEIDIAALIAKLLVQQQIELKYGGQKLASKDVKVNQLRNSKEIDKVVISRRIAVSEDLKRKAIKFLREYLNRQNIPEMEQALVDFTIRELETLKSHYQEILNQYRFEAYPDKELVEASNKLISSILSNKNDNTILLDILVKKQDELLDNQEDMEPVEEFFRSQKTVFDSAKNYLQTLENDKDYFIGNDVIETAICKIKEILQMDQPYDSIEDLPELSQIIKLEYAKLIKKHRGDVEKLVDQALDEIEIEKHELKNSNGAIAENINFLKQKKASLATMDSITNIEAAIPMVNRYKENTIILIKRLIENQNKTPGGKPAGPSVTPLKETVRKVQPSELCSKKILSSTPEIDSYVSRIRGKLIGMLMDNDKIEIE